MINFYNFIKQKPFFIYFTIYLRYLLGGVFVYATLWKLPMLNVDPALLTETSVNPVFAFQALMRIEYLWDAVLLFQFISGTLLLTQRFASLGALLYFPVILGICLLTISIGFKGTWVITSLMVLANLYLLCWDFDKWKGLFYNNGNFTISNHPLAIDKYWVINGIILWIISMLYYVHHNIFLWLMSCFAWGLLSFVFYVARRKRLVLIRN